MKTTALLAAAFNFERTAASGVIGAGVALIGVTIAQFLKNPPPPEPGETVRRMKPITGIALLIAGVILTYVGAVWRMSTNPGRG